MGHLHIQMVHVGLLDLCVERVGNDKRGQGYGGQDGQED